MKNSKIIFTLITSAILIIACQKKETTVVEVQKIDSTKIIDSINTVRKEINDSIKTTNKFASLGGTHTITHDMMKGFGKVLFEKVKTNRDEYSVKGNFVSGSNYLKINGTALRVSPKHFNFYGEIAQSISENAGGKPYVRKSGQTFVTKDGGKTWKLQANENPSGFVDKIEIKF